MIIFYIVSCLLCLALILCNLHFADNKLKGWQIVSTLVVSFIPFVNTMFIILVLFVAARMVADEGKKT
jgi:hypothetical protein